MSFNATAEDLRSVKTKKLLYAAMSSLLRNQSFRKITIKGICEEAFISRAAFYAHFVDKYDLLEHWMAKLWPKSISLSSGYEEIEKAVNDYIDENRLMFENLVCDADEETLHILFEHILSVVGLASEKDVGEAGHIKHTVASNFCAGGMIYYISWHIKNKFPADVPVMNRHLYKTLEEIKGSL